MSKDTWTKSMATIVTARWVELCEIARAKGLSWPDEFDTPEMHQAWCIHCDGVQEIGAKGCLKCADSLPDTNPSANPQPAPSGSTKGA